MVKKLLLILAAGGVLAAVIFFMTRDRSLENPRALVPSKSDLYVEITSIADLDSALADITQTAGYKISLADIAGNVPSRILKAVASDTSGFDRSRPIGYAARFTGEAPVAVTFVPIEDLDAVTEMLGVDPDGLFIRSDRGYLLIAEKSEMLDDLAALPEGEKGIAFSDPEPGTIISAKIQPHLIAWARGSIGDTSEIAKLFAAKVLDGVKGVDMALRWTSEGLRFRTNIAMTDIFLNAATGKGKPALLEHLPLGGMVAGARVDPDAARPLVKSFIDDLITVIPDARAKELLAKAPDLITPEAASAMFSAAPGGEVSGVNIFRLPKGKEDEYIALHRALQMETAIWSAATQSMEAATIQYAPLPSTNYRGVVITGLKTEMSLGMEPPPGADPATIEMIRRANEQKVIQRFGRVGEFFIAAVGEDAGIIASQIDLLMGGDTGPAQATSSPGINRVAELLGEDIFAYAILDPTAFTGGSTSEAAHAFGVSIGRTDGMIAIDVIWPREHMQGIAMQIMGAMMGMGLGPR